MPEVQDQNTDSTTETAAAPVAPDALTAAASAAAAADAAAGKTTEQIEADAQAERDATAAQLAKVKPKYYSSVNGGVLIDPETLKEFNGENPIKSPMTSWLKFQIDNKKIAED